MRYLYTILLYLATPFLVLRLFWRSRKNNAYRQRWLERLGVIPPLVDHRRCIWIHAVSLGESIAATPLIDALLKRYPNYCIAVTTTTPTGSLQIQKTFGQRIYHVYAPYDLPHVIQRFLHVLRPIIVIIMETELWPNLLSHLNQAHIPVMIANARLSERSFLRYHRIKRFLTPLLASIQMIAAQSHDDGQRFAALGVSQPHIHVTGNIKFDNIIPDSTLDAAKILRKHWETRLTLIAASTHDGEEIQILHAFKKIQLRFPTALLIIAPRHPERFSAVADLCQNANYSLTRRSQQQLPDMQSSIYLADTTGELLLLYAASDVAFVGGSLVPTGGHNLIEPASLARPVISGPYLNNFSAIKTLLSDNEALILVNNADELATQVIQLFTDQEMRHHYGARALSVSEQNRGAVAKHLQWIEETIATADGCFSLRRHRRPAS